MVTVTLIAVFMLVYVCVVYALEQTEFRKGKFVLAFPVGILCILSLLRGTGNTQEKNLVDIVLIPYEALAYTFIFIAILWILLFLFRSRIPKMLGRWHVRLKSENEDIGQKHRTVTNQEKRLKEYQDKTCL